MTSKTLIRSVSPFLSRYTQEAKNRAQVEHRTMNVFEHVGTDARTATHMLQVRPDEDDDPPDGWALVAIVRDPT